MVWPHDGAKGISSSNPAKVCAITRKLYKNLSRDCLCKPFTQMSENCDGKLTKELGDDALLFEIGPFNETLGLDPDVGGGGGTATVTTAMGLTLRATRRTRTNFSETAIRATW